MTRSNRKKTPAPGKTGRKTWPVLSLLVLIAAASVIVWYMTQNGKPQQSDGDHGNMDYGQVTFLTPEGKKIITLLVEIAEDEYEQVTGLMFREDVSESQGMIFLYDDEDLRYFWMKNTPKSLDMIFVNSDLEIVNIEKYTTPMSEQLYPSRFPAQYVVETIAGYTDQYDIRVGSRIEWKKQADK